MSDSKEISQGKQNTVELSLQNRELATIMAKNFNDFYENLTNNMGVSDFVYQAKRDFTKRRIIGRGTEDRIGALFIDLIPKEENLRSFAELSYLPYEELFQEEGDSTHMPENVIMRTTTKVGNINEHTAPSTTYLIEVRGEIDIDEALKFADHVTSGMKRIIPSTLEINTTGRSPHELSQRLTKAFDFLIPNILEYDMQEAYASAIEGKTVQKPDKDIPQLTEEDKPEKKGPNLKELVENRISKQILEEKNSPSEK